MPSASRRLCTDIWPPQMISRPRGVGADFFFHTHRPAQVLRSLSKILPVPRKPRASGPPLKNATRWCRCQHQPLHRGSQSMFERPSLSGSRVASDRRAPTPIPTIDKAHLALRRLLPIRLGRPRTPPATVAEVDRGQLLIAAGLHPRQRPRDLDLKTRNRLARSTLKIGWRAYRGGGVSNPEALAAALNASGQRRRGYRFAVISRSVLCHPLRRAAGHGLSAEPLGAAGHAEVLEAGRPLSASLASLLSLYRSIAILRR